MAFINLERVDTNFGKTAPIKCPICGNDFLVGQTVVSRVAGLI